jgi:hypothetical protein
MESIKPTFNILLDLRYWKWVYDIFDGKDYSQHRLKIIFLKDQDWYKIESIYIISPEKDWVWELIKWKDNFNSALV